MLTLSLSDRAVKAPSKKAKKEKQKNTEEKKTKTVNKTKQNIEKTKQSNNKKMKTENVKLIVKEKKTWLNITTWISYKGMNRCNGSYIIIINIHICILYYYY